MSWYAKLSMVCPLTSACLPVTAVAAANVVKFNHTCAAIRWNPQFLAAYPTAAAACRDVVRVNGVAFAEFRGTILQVNHDVVQVEVSDVAGIGISTIAFLTGKDGQVVIDGAGRTVSSLKRGPPRRVSDLEGSSHADRETGTRRGTHRKSRTPRPLPRSAMRRSGRPTSRSC